SRLGWPGPACCCSGKGGHGGTSPRTERALARAALHGASQSLPWGNRQVPRSPTVRPPGSMAHTGSRRGPMTRGSPGRLYPAEAAERTAAELGGSAGGGVVPARLGIAWTVRPVDLL